MAGTIRSMTGFGTFTKEDEIRIITVEVKSLNSKSLDLSLRLPRQFSDKEHEIRNLVSKTLERGKVSLSVEYEKKGSVGLRVSVNKELFHAYYAHLKELAEEVGQGNTDLFKTALQMPDVYSGTSEKENTEDEWLLFNNAIELAIHKLDDFRLTEGKELQSKLEEYIFKIAGLLEKVGEADPGRINRIRERLWNKVAELKAEADQGRFEQELIYYLEKLDITEEKVRLKTHLDYFIDTIRNSDAPGKKLGFIAQEIGREINTIGSKANDAEIQKLVVEMKEELERIKEQSLNIL